MPLLGTLLVVIFEKLTAFLAFFGLQALAAVAIRRGLIVALTVGFVAAVSSCLSFLLGAVSSLGGAGSLPGSFLMGLGMFVPSNAVAVMSCLAAVWLACFMYRLKLAGLKH